MKACFNVTESPKPSLKIDEQPNKIVKSSVEIDQNCLYFVLENVKDVKNLTVEAENGFGQSNVIISFPKFQS